MSARNSTDTNVNDLPAWVTSRAAAEDLRSSRAVEVIEEDAYNWEIDRVKYQEARRELRHLSQVSYIILAFFAVATGWFLSMPDPRPYLALVIGSVFLMLLYMLAKTSRVAEDNMAIVKKLDRTYKSKARFKSSSVEGVGGFLSYLVLSCTTAFFLLFPNVYQLSYHRMRFFGPFLLLSAAVFFVSYYVLADGKMGRATLNKLVTGRKLLGFIGRRAKVLQVLCYSATFLALLFYWYIAWF